MTVITWESRSGLRYEAKVVGQSVEIRLPGTRCYVLADAVLTDLILDLARSGIVATNEVSHD